MRGRRLRTLTCGVAAFVAAAGVLAACTGSSAKPAQATTVTTRAVPTINQGGDIVVAAGGEPGCMDWISTCAGSAWGIWTVQTNTMPRAYDFTRDNQYKPSILLTGEAEVQTGQEQVVTYHLNPRAVWNDGQPITSHDFKYTWDQVAHGQNIHDQSGYKNIVSVDDSDPHIAVVTFSQSFADWRRLFGGSYGLLPSHLLEGQDRNALMKDGYTWSGGPWALAPAGWVRGQSIKLVPNPNYWGKKPDLASVTFRIFTDDGAEQRAFIAGEVLAAYPRPDPVSAGYRGGATTFVGVTAGLDYEALWFDVQRAPMSTKAVRQAVAYSLDRGAIATQLLGQLLPGVQPIQDLLPPPYGQFYFETFSKYRPDLTTATQLMQGDGWAKDGEGMWTKGGVRATIEIKVPASSPGGTQLAQLIVTQLHVAGFVVAVTPETPETLLTKDLPAGMFTAALYSVDLRRQLSAVPVGAGIDDNDPGLCRLFCSTSIPTPANGGLGANYGRVADPTLDRYLADLDTNLSDSARLVDAEQAADILAELVPAIPLFALPDIVVVNTAKVGVEGGTFSHNLAYGPYEYLNEWYLR
ncbi:MAG: peptide/nickel transport system substrate-binding protein [Acidimicrobiaceae bacterium]|nr:peptide/nickel transport system substrate-binding protein [Acidimicrobiaceae bacterium]